MQSATQSIDAFLSWQGPHNPGRLYVMIYGILQLLYVEQDAVRVLCNVLGPKSGRVPEIDEIRRIRNSAIGHPMRTRSDGGSHGIVRVSMSARGFQLSSYWPDHRYGTQYVDLRELIEQQRNALAEAMVKVLDQLREQERMHRSNFRKTKLRSLFPDTLSYYCEKMFQGTEEGDHRQWAGAHAKMLLEVLERFEHLLKGRGDFRKELAWEIGRVRYPLIQLKNFFEHDEESHLRPSDICIYVYFVSHEIWHLKKIAEEIDDEYERDPDTADP